MSIFDFALEKFKKMNTEEIEKGLNSLGGWGGELHKNPDTTSAAHYELQRRYKELEEKKHRSVFILNIITAISSAVVAVGIFCAFYQLKLSKEIAIADFTIKLDQEFNSADMKALRKKVVQLDFTKPEKAEDCSKILDFFERIAYLEKKGVIDLETIDEMWGWWIENYWVLCKGYLQYWWTEEPGSYDLTRRLFNRLELKYMKEEKNTVKQEKVNRELEEYIKNIKKE